MYEVWLHLIILSRLEHRLHLRAVFLDWVTYFWRPNPFFFGFDCCGFNYFLDQALVQFFN